MAHRCAPASSDTAELICAATPRFSWEAWCRTSAFAYSVGFTFGAAVARAPRRDIARRRGGEKHGGVIAWVGVLFGCTLAVRPGARRSHSTGAGRSSNPCSYIGDSVSGHAGAFNWQNAKAFSVRYVLVGLPMYLALIASSALHPCDASFDRVCGRSALVTVTRAASLWNYYQNPLYAKGRRSRPPCARWKRASSRASASSPPTVWQVVQHYQAPVATPSLLCVRWRARIDDAGSTRPSLRAMRIDVVRARAPVGRATRRDTFSKKSMSRYVRGETLGSPEFPRFTSHADAQFILPQTAPALCIE